MWMVDLHLFFLPKYPAQKIIAVTKQYPPIFVPLNKRSGNMVSLLLPSSLSVELYGTVNGNQVI